MTEWLNIVIDLIENRPTVLLVLAMGVAIWWLVKKLQAKDRMIARKDSVISRLTNSLIELHSSGVELDQTTKIMAGIGEERRKKTR